MLAWIQNKNWHWKQKLKLKTKTEIQTIQWIVSISFFLSKVARCWWLQFQFLAEAESCSASMLLVFSTTAYNRLHHHSPTFPRPSCSSSIASSFTMFSCFTFSSTYDRKSFQLAHTVRWFWSELTSNSLIWTSCGRMCDSWLNVFTWNANLMSLTSAVASITSLDTTYDKLSDQWHVSVPPCHQNSDGW